MATFVYGLYSSGDPFNFRYIGVSKYPMKRLYSHVRGTRDPIKFSENPHKSRWILQEISKNNTIEVTVLKQFDTDDEAYEEEKWMISHMKAYGYNLTNITQGGKGGHFSNPVVYDRIKQKASDGRKTEEFKERARLNAHKQFSSKESREKARQHALRGWETRSNREAWNKGIKFENYNSYWDTLTPEKRSDMVLKTNLTRRYNRAKKKGLTLELNPICHSGKEPK